MTRKILTILVIIGLGLPLINSSVDAASPSSLTVDTVLKNSIPSIAKPLNAIVADWDSDGENEIVATFRDGDPTAPNGFIAAYEFDGSNYVEEFRMNSPTRYPLNIAVGDVNGDGRNEIVFGTGRSDSGGYIYVIADGGIVWRSNWIGSFRRMTQLALGDSDGDGEDEIAISVSWYGRYLALYDHVGSNNFQRVLYARYVGDGNSVGIGDIDGDGHNEVVFGMGCNSSMNFRTYQFNGTSYTNIWNKSVSNQRCYRSFLAIGDVDNDGKDELVSTFGEVWEAEVLIMEGSQVDWWGGPYRPGGRYRSAYPTIGSFLNNGRNQVAFLAESSTANEWAIHFVEHDGSEYQYLGTLDRDNTKQAGRPFIGDADNDGLNEIVLPEYSEGDYSINIYTSRMSGFPPLIDAEIARFETEVEDGEKDLAQSKYNFSTILFPIIEGLDGAAVLIHCGIASVPPITAIGVFTCTAHVGFALSLNSVLAKKQEVLQKIIDDPPDQDYMDLAVMRDVKPIIPPDDSELSIARVEYLTLIDEQVALLEAFLTSFERFKGAIDADNPQFILIQARAVEQYLHLLTLNQNRMVTAIAEYRDKYASFISPLREDFTPILVQVANTGFDENLINFFGQIGITGEEIQSLEDLIAAIPSPDSFDEDALLGLQDWETFIEVEAIPATENDLGKMTELVALLDDFSIPEVPNDPPNANPGSGYSVAEGGKIVLDGSAIDPDGGPLTFEWDLENDGSFETPWENPVFSAVDRDGPDHQTVVLQVCDLQGACDRDSTNIEILNVPPDANAGQDQTVYRFDTIDLFGSWSDPAGGLDDPYMWTWDLDGDSVVDSSGSSSYGVLISESVSFDLEGIYTLPFSITDKDGGTSSDSMQIEVLNRPPVCDQAIPSIDRLWPVNHKFVPIEIQNVWDPEGDPFTLTVESIFQDEPLDELGDGDTQVDGRGLGESIAEVRAERSGIGNGRFYHITFSVDDGHGGVCLGEVLVGVPFDSSPKSVPLDEGPLYDSAIPINE